MKRFQIFTGGQPVRPDDFQMVQNEAMTTAFEMIKGLCDAAQAAVISGLKLTNTGGTNYAVSPGYFFDGVELCYTPGLNFILDEARTLYLVKNETEESLRQFKNLAYHKVIINREYTVVYETAPPANSFQYDLLERMVNLLSINANPVDFLLTVATSPDLSPGYHGIGVYEKVHVLTNAYRDVTILAQFTTEIVDGVVCVIPTTTISVPSPVYGQFWNGTAWKRFIWHTDGRLELFGAGTSSAVNYIQFQCNINISWPTI